MGVQFQKEGGGPVAPHPKILFEPIFFWKMGDLYFQIFGIKIDHFWGLNWPLEGQGRARESKIVPKKGLKQALFGPFWFYT